MPNEKKPIALVLRHGTTNMNIDNKFRGFLNPKLDDKGIVDAHKAAEYLKSCHVERIVCSPLNRAYQTAQIVSGVIGGRFIEQCNSLFPWAVPEIMGKDRDEYADVLDHFIDNKDEVPEDGESLNQFMDRVGDYFEEAFKIPSLTLYVTHISDIVTLTDLIHGDSSGRPEEGEVVAPGGIIAVYEEAEGYSTDVVFGKAKTAEYGS